MSGAAGAPRAAAAAAAGAAAPAEPAASRPTQLTNLARPATPPQDDSVRNLLGIGKDLVSSRPKRDLSSAEKNAENARVAKSMRQLVDNDSHVRDLAKKRVSAAHRVLSMYSEEEESDGDGCKMRATLAVAALGTPEPAFPL